MVREKVAPVGEQAEILYDEERWAILKTLREKCALLFRVLGKFRPAVYGSVARGDVHEGSDVDVVIPYTIAEFELLTLLDRVEFRATVQKFVVQATPLAALKALIVLDETTAITYPLVPFLAREYEFFRFGGWLEAPAFDLTTRVPGVNKKLLLVTPTPAGHVTTRVTRENAGQVARVLDIQLQTVLERIRVLTRRDAVGRTGVYLRRELAPDESFGEVVRDLAASNPATKRRLRRKR